MSRRVVAALAAIALVVAAAYAGSPFWAARAFRNAAVSGDVDGLNAAVDFPAVRESLKGQLAAALAATMQRDPAMRNNPFAGLGLAIMPAVIDRMVDTLVTADGIAAMVKQGRVQRDATGGAGSPTVTYRYAYRGLDHFAITALGPGTDPDQAPVFVFERRGVFAWKMIRLELPATALSR